MNIDDSSSDGRKQHQPEQRIFCCPLVEYICVELDAAVIQEPAESFPAGQCVTDRVGQAAFWWDPFKLCFEPDLHGLDQRQRLDPSYGLSCLGRLASDARPVVC
jgi:hypothetical protein